jgi:hypothetical protein
MILSFHDIRNSRQNKNRQPIRAAVSILRRRFYSVSFLTAHHRKLPFPIKGTLALHCQVARLLSESFLMLDRIVPSRCLDATKICVIAENHHRIDHPRFKEWAKCGLAILTRCLRKRVRFSLTQE